MKQLFDLASKRHSDIVKQGGIIGSALLGGAKLIVKNPLKTLGAALTGSEIAGAAKSGSKIPGMKMMGAAPIPPGV